MTSNGLWFFLVAALVALAETSWGQRASNWRAYKVADGLPQSACLSLTFSAQGKVFVRHLDPPSISELDGYSVHTFPAPEMGTGRVYQSPAGQLWTVVREGLEEFKAGAWVLHPLPDVMTGFRSDLPLLPVRQDRVLVLLPERLLELNADEPERSAAGTLRAATNTGLGGFSGMSLSHDGGLWIAGTRGLARVDAPIRNLKSDTPWRDFLAPESWQLENLREPREDDDGAITTVAEAGPTHESCLVHFDGQQWSRQLAGKEKLRAAWRGPDKRFWAASLRSLFEWDQEHAVFVENEEIAARQYFDVATEPGGFFWLATSDGLFRCAPMLWRSPQATRKLNSPLSCLAGDMEGRLWFIAGGTLHCLQNDRLREYLLPDGLRGWSVRALVPQKDGELLLAAADEVSPEKEPPERLFRFQPAQGRFTALEDSASGRDLRILGVLADGSLCVQRGGSGPANGAGELERYNGTSFVELCEAPSMPVAGERFRTLFAGRSGDLWLGGPHATAWYHERRWRTFVSTDKTTPEGALGFVELADGKIWCATPERLWEFDGKNWTMVRRGFDRINALLGSRDGSVWVASDGGLFRFFQGAWIENGLEEGLPSTGVRQVCEDQHGRVWAGTTHGLSQYHPEADPDPPQAEIQQQGAPENRLPEGGTIALTLTGRDKWKYSARERLLYSYRLDERDWSPFFGSDTISFTDLSAGKHYFQVRAMDRNGNMTAKPAQLEFAVILPWYRETRLVLIASAGLVGALFFAGLAFNRHRQLLRSYAEVEQKVTQRTQELEAAGRELLHSQKMNALGALAAGIAHDFNNILSIVQGSAQIIEDNLDNPGKVRTRVERIKTVVEQGSGIVKAMLGFSRDSGQQPAACDVNAVVDDTIKLLGDRFLRETQIRFEPAPALPSVPTFKDFIQQVLLNFIFNAAESMDKRKQIWLATSRMKTPGGGLILAPAPADEYVGVSVQDFGCGIPAENLPRIFEPFFTTKALSTRRGTGLGLSMAYELARKMGAGLAVVSVVGQGSTFTLLLPARDSVPEADK